MTSLNFSRIATVTASTERAPTIASGKRGDSAEEVASLSCTPLDPLDPDIQMQFGTTAPMELLQTFVQGDVDIIEGDVLVVSSTSYRVRSAGEWTWPTDSETYLHLILEEIKTT
jgi:hypothetical protein